ncbi:PH domain-containing protein [Hymenobacter weizhouensis]|uniref:PH domain-containing protein n=1 Tax=Hymenobacter sp. YIM 151500-1 TaxID=2987689 RepID=UPI0022270A53|nr:PH domain-containing protein [Hymenobacter sp. YIM 151500-1]UYZ65158.1 PH domain-containing protein [Hymenobacter sp. YIM 151500-1]
MVDVTIQGSDVLFDVKGLHKLWAFKSQLQIPRAHIRAVRQDPNAHRGWWKGWRVPGTHIPGVLVAGTYLREGKCVFWDVRNAKNALVIDLKDDSYDQLVIEVKNPAAVMELLGTPVTA